MPLQPTSSQEKFFATMDDRGKEGTGDRYGSSLFFHFLRKEETRRRFFSLFAGRESDEDPVPEGNPIYVDYASVQRFTDEVEKYGLDDFRVIRGIQELVLQAGNGLGCECIDSIESLANVKMGHTDFIPNDDDGADSDQESETESSFSRRRRRERKGEWEFRDHSDEIFQHTIELLEGLKVELEKVGSMLEEHGIMENTPQVLVQIDICIDILRNVEVKQDGRTYHCSVPPEIAMPFEQVDRQLAIEEQALHPHIQSCISDGHYSHGIDSEAVQQDPAICLGFAKGMYVQHLGLDRYLQYYQLLAVLLEYAAQCKKQDGPRYGTAPVFLTGVEGLTFNLKSLVHPQWAQGEAFVPRHEKKEPDWESMGRRMRDSLGLGDVDEDFETEPDIPELEKEKTPEEQAKEDLWSHLEEKGCLRRVAKNDERRRKDSMYWYPGLSRNGLVAVLERCNAPDNLCGEVFACYDAYGFNPFQKVAVDSRERIQILTGANSNGKSTLMRAIASALNTGMAGRKIQGVDSEMSYCDGIYHDFEVHDNLQEGVSTFRAQVRNVLTFLKDATPQSLGLFDEMYHGTSSLYLLALAWATVESFSRRNLRAIISTHEPLLTFSTRGDGLGLLRGIYTNQRKMIGGAVNGGIDGVGNISMRNHYELREGAVMDSDAFRVAREEKMPTKILNRAEHIKGVLMGEAEA